MVKFSGKWLNSIANGLSCKANGCSTYCKWKCCMANGYVVRLACISVLDSIAKFFCSKGLCYFTTIYALLKIIMFRYNSYK